jgi:hypothetical protein
MLCVVQTCLDLNFEIEKHGRNSPIAKIFRRPYSGRDRRRPFAQQFWKMLQ